MAAIGLLMLTMPFAVATGLTCLCRHRHPAVHLVIWLLGIPVMYLLCPLLIAIVSFQVFGVDLLD